MAELNEGSHAPERRPGWTFLTNHGHVLLAVASDPDIRVADVARRVGITPRAALLILKDLEADGYLQRHRVGRRSHYTVHHHRPFRHPSLAEYEVDQLLGIFICEFERRGDRPPAPPPRTSRSASGERADPAGVSAGA